MALLARATPRAPVVVARRLVGHLPGDNSRSAVVRKAGFGHLEKKREAKRREEQEWKKRVAMNAGSGAWDVATEDPTESDLEDSFPDMNDIESEAELKEALDWFENFTVKYDPNDPNSQFIPPRLRFDENGVARKWQRPYAATYDEEYHRWLDLYNSHFVSLLTNDAAVLKEFVEPYVRPAEEKRYLRFSFSRDAMSGPRDSMRNESTRKVRLDVKVSKLGLSKEARHKLKILAGKRYCLHDDNLTITSSLYPDQPSNQKDVLDMLAKLIQESQVNPFEFLEVNLAEHVNTDEPFRPKYPKDWFKRSLEETAKKEKVLKDLEEEKLKTIYVGSISDKLNVEKHQAEIKTTEGRVNNAIKLFKGFA